MYCSNRYNTELTLLTEMIRDGYAFQLSSATIKSRQPKYAVVMVYQLIKITRNYND
jgi:hypothetical protein